MRSPCPSFCRGKGRADRSAQGTRWSSYFPSRPRQGSVSYFIMGGDNPAPKNTDRHGRRQSVTSATAVRCVHTSHRWVRWRVMEPTQVSHFSPLVMKACLSSLLDGRIICRALVEVGFPCLRL